MRRVVPLLLAFLVVGCSPVIQPSPPPVASAPETTQALPVHAPLPDDAPVGLVTRDRARDPFSLPGRPPVISDPGRVYPNPNRHPTPVSRPSADGVAQKPVMPPAYTVSGIVQSERGPVALMTGRDGVVLVQPGTRLPGQLRVDAIGEGVVYVVGQGHRYVLPLRPSDPRWQTRHSPPTQEPAPTAENVS